MTKATRSIQLGMLLTAGCIARLACAQPDAAKIAANPLRNAYFGQLHLHTGMSFDAFLGGTRLYPEDAYRLARGETLQYQGGTLKSDVPLDFLGVSDHSEYLGQIRVAADAGGPLAQTGFGQELAKASEPADRRGVMFRLSDSFGSGGEKPPELLQKSLQKTAWQRQVDAAEKYYEPGKFTTFVAYEYSSIPNGANLHRNVIFRGPKYPEVPFSSLDSANPEDLWRWIEHQRSLGIQVISIPHNSNVSDGLMFSYADSARNPIDREYAETRVSIERLAEITQIKGTSETRPELSPEDEFAGFELIGNLLTVPRPGSIHGSYIREAYARGLEIARRTGVNPFEFGLIGASDDHNAMPSTAENKITPQGDVKKILESTGELGGAKMSSAGLAGVWAESNTRESIFDALYRRETFATSGTRLRVRFFGGYQYTAGLMKQQNWLKRAYANGVPMGADLTAPPGNQGASPRFLVQAVKDPNGANLDRIQIVKVWVDKGVPQEKVFDIAWAGDRQPNAAGKLPGIGSTVDVEHATYTNNIGASELSTEWQDPTFRPDTAAVYYVRVLEIPTPRWTTYLAAQNKLPVPSRVPAEIQERAWTSPIFYHP